MATDPPRGVKTSDAAKTLLQVPPRSSKVEDDSGIGGSQSMNLNDVYFSPDSGMT